MKQMLLNVVAPSIALLKKSELELENVQQMAVNMKLVINYRL